MQFTNPSKLIEFCLRRSIKRSTKGENPKRLGCLCCVQFLPLPPPLSASCVCKSHLSNFCVIYSPLKENQTTQSSRRPIAPVLSKQKERRSEILKAERVSFFAYAEQHSVLVARIEFPSPWGIRRSALMTQKCQWNLLNSGRNGGGGRSSSELLCPEIAN